MSIINKILQEIEKTRKTGSIQTPQGELELGTAFNKYKKSFFNSFIAIAFLVVIFSLMGIILYKSSGVRSHSEKDLSAAEKTAALSNKKALPMASKDSVVPAKLRDITLNVENNKTQVNFVLDRDTHYYVERGQDQQQLKLILGNTVYDNATFPLNFTHTAIKTLSVAKSSSSNNNTEISLSLLPDTQVIGLQIYNQPQTYLQLVLLNTNTPNGAVVKTVVPLTSQQRSLQDYQDALELLNQNQVKPAIAKLRSAVKSAQNNEDAYELLVTLLIKNEQFNDATKVLNSAAKSFPKNQHFEQFRAYVLEQKGEAARALQVLLKSELPDIDQDPDCYAFIASLYQQQGQFILAAQLYNRLLKIQPSRAMWWVGLGIALESAGKQNAAQEAYRRAITFSDLPSAVSSFVSGKIKKL